LGEDKSSVVTLVREFIAGDVFLKETVQKQYLYVLLIFVLSLVYINNRFLYERELREIARLRSEVVDLRYRSLTISKEVKQAGRRTMIIEALKAHGSDLEETAKPIVVIED
jgi:cell division protein FtsL